MFSRYFSGDALLRYQQSPHKCRMDRIAQCMVELRYVTFVIIDRLHEWLRFTTYFDERELPLPSKVRSQEVQQYAAQRAPDEAGSRFRAVRASVRILLESNESGQFTKRIRTPRLAASTGFAPLIESYLRFIGVHRNLAERTRNKREWQLARFSRFLDIDGVHEITSIHASQIRQFLLSLEGQKSATILTYVVTLRSFFRWAFLEKVLPMDFSSAAISPKRYRRSALRDILGDSEMEQILSAVDRSTAIGRRDFAVLLLAVRYGLRPCDIRQLRLDDIHWREEVIMVHQSKTKRLLTLPLLRDVAHALSDYLQHGRPVTEARQIFVRHLAPFEPFVASNNLAAIMRKALHCGGLGDRKGRRGLYLFRHTLATRMLSAGCPMKSIGDVLGHSSTETTMEYANVDLNALRTVAISEAEVRS